MRRAAAILLIVSLLCVPAAGAGISVSAEAAILIDAETGEELFARGADARMQPASMTKIMTALIVAERLDPDRTVTVPPCAVGTEGSSAYLEAGEKFTVYELLHALLLQSANDAAVTLAEACGGVDAFVALMNEKASALGLGGTHFSNPHGLSEKDHYSTARDIASLLCVCMRSGIFREICGKVSFTVKPDETRRGREFVNHNKLLYACDGVVGGKTGYTRSSGRCLCSYYDKDGLRLCAVTMNAPRDWEDHKALYRYGESFYDRITVDADEFFSLHVVGGLTDHVDCTLKKTFTAAVRTGSKIEKTVCMRRFEYAPVAAGERVGTVIWQAGGKTIHEEKLYADYKAEAVKNTPGDVFKWKK